MCVYYRKRKNRRRNTVLQEELYNLYLSPNTAEVMKSKNVCRPGHKTDIEYIRNILTSLIERNSVQITLGRHKRIWDNNIKMTQKNEMRLCWILQDRD
jgi:hypothetical protein